MNTYPTVAMGDIMDLTPLHLVVEVAAKSVILRMSREGLGLGLESVNLVLSSLPRQPHQSPSVDPEIIRTARLFEGNRQAEEKQSG